MKKLLQANLFGDKFDKQNRQKCESEHFAHKSPKMRDHKNRTQFFIEEFY